MEGQTLIFIFQLGDFILFYFSKNEKRTPKKSDFERLFSPFLK
jgi:hypothetical protein